MASVVIETLGCPLDPDLLKSWEKFSLESSQSQSSSDYSESDDEGTEIKNNGLLEQLKNLTFDDVSDTEYVTSECSNKNSEINFQEINNSGKLVFVEKRDAEENLSYSSHKYEELLKFDTEADAKSTFEREKCSNGENYEIISKKITNTEKSSVEEKLQNTETELYSLSLKNNKVLNKCHNSSSHISAWEESDSDNDEEEESVTLRERDPTRHNRPGNNRQQRSTPFYRNQSNTSRPHLHSTNLQTFENFRPDVFYDFNSLHTSHNSINQINNTSSEGYGNVSPSSRTFQSDYPLSESVSYEAAFEDMIPSIVEDQFFDDISPSTGESQIVNGIVPYTVTNQINEGIVPCTVDAVLDSVVHSADGIGNLNNNFSEEIADARYFENLKERILSGCPVTDAEKETLLHSYLDKLTPEELKNILINLTDSTLYDFSSENHVDLVEESPLQILTSKEAVKAFDDSSILNRSNHVVSSVMEISNPNNNRQNFHPVPNQGHSPLSNPNAEEASLYSNSYEDNRILETSDQFYTSGYPSVTKLGSYSDLICKNITSINCESLSPENSDYNVISNEIEHEIIKWEEIEKWAKKAQKNMPELSREIDRSEFPFNGLDDNAILECISIPKSEISNKRNNPERQIINQTYKSPCKTEKIPICWMLGTAARDKLFNSPSFCKRKYKEENEEIKNQIKIGMLGTKEKKVIHAVKRNRRLKYRGTNLHYAIRDGKTERVFCLVECHKELHGNVSEINVRDSFNKTVLDYAKEKRMDLLSDYLEENTARVSINVK